ncbi:type II toxin-antitoxin system RelE/ParE family toxin [Flavobacterium praedii]|uniref:type II toxin-antitoxin system RelE/ParE family toxin n=1 Tax=Flavobacterium praedii TaxID=3002900 RepID=UPI002481F7C5|nr:type II toxin-antitoxin system RelE/ParE family toxin [Flavobacterium praedii]
MALSIRWTPQAEKGLDSVLLYLEEFWSIKEILQLEEKIKQVTRLIILYPELFPKSETHQLLHKAIIDKNNYLVYRVNTKRSRIEIVNFRGTKQNPKY